ncbi:MAG: PAS domain-containing protein [Corynebacterium sp.]|nr:PAS domain-containing protein [Corynebacterium sp.]
MAEQPTHDVGPDQIFFSTTDPKGVITDANSVFTHLARYERGELIGSAHNIIRNPLMPGGVFTMMWDHLEAHEPFVGYVANQAKDGSRYNVLATVSPLEDGTYLSVRTRPSDSDLAAALWNTYEKTRERENAYRTDTGASKADAAAWSKDLLLEAIRGLGYDSYDAFMLWLLPHEMKLWEKNNPRGFTPPTDERLSPLAGRVGDLLVEEEVWIGRQDALTELEASLLEGVSSLEETNAVAHTVAAELERVEGAGELEEDELIPLAVGLRMADIVGEYITGLRDLFAELSVATKKTRFQVALARLQTHTVGRFVEDLATGADEVPAIRMLCSALAAETMEMSKDIHHHQMLLNRAKRRISTVISLITLPQMAIQGWRSDVEGTAAAGPAQGLLHSVADAVDSMNNLTERLRGLVEQCESLEPGHGPEALVDIVSDIDRTASGLAVNA